MLYHILDYTSLHCPMLFLLHYKSIYTIFAIAHLDFTYYSSSHVTFHWQYHYKIIITWYKSVFSFPPSPPHTLFSTLRWFEPQATIQLNPIHPSTHRTTVLHPSEVWDGFNIAWIRYFRLSDSPPPPPPPRQWPSVHWVESMTRQYS